MQWNCFVWLFWCVFTTSKLAIATVPGAFTSIQFSFKCGQKYEHVGVWVVRAWNVCGRATQEQMAQSTRRNENSIDFRWCPVSIGGNQQNEINRFSMFGKITLFLLSSRPIASPWSVYSAQRELDSKSPFSVRVSSMAGQAIVVSIHQSIWFNVKVSIVEVFASLELKLMSPISTEWNARCCR